MDNLLANFVKCGARKIDGVFHALDGASYVYKIYWVGSYIRMDLTPIPAK